MTGSINRDGLLVLSEYSAYANHLVLDVVDRIGAEQLTSPSSPSHGSILSVLQHMFIVEASYLAKCQGRRPGVAADEIQTLASLRDHWSTIEEERKSYLAESDEPSLQQQRPIELQGKTFQLAPWQMLVQSLIHSIHHRGELSIVLTELGHPLPTLDIIIHFVKSSGQEWPWD